MGKCFGFSDNWPIIWADIGTKCLPKQRLLVLMHACGLVYLPDGNEVGVEEVQRQVEKAGNSKMIKRVAKAVMRMSVAMGLEPIGAQGKSNIKSPKSNLRGISGCLLLRLSLASLF